MVIENNYLLSVVIPVYESGDSIMAIVDDLYLLYGAKGLQVVLVNDGSKDDSPSHCEVLAHKYESVTFIELRKNFGEHCAVMCGLSYAIGEYVVIMDDDMQNPPEELSKLLDYCGKADVVYTCYPRKRHHVIRNIMSKINDLFATWLIGKPPGLYLSSFKLVNQEIVKEIIKYTGPFPYVDGLILRVTQSYVQVEVEHHARKKGKSTYTLIKLFNLWLSMFVNFSIKPMRVMIGTGVLVSTLSFSLGIYAFIEKLFYPDTEIGWSSIMVSITFLFGMQFMFLGIIGEYLGKQYLDQNGTPQWVIRRKIS